MSEILVRQGELALAWGIATREEVAQAFDAARAANTDIGAILASWGRLSGEQCEQLRQASASSSQSSASWAGAPSALTSASQLSSSQVSGSGSAPSAGGRVIPGYEILREISRGGMGVVFEARHELSERRVALKVMLRDSAPSTELRRFEREGRTLGQLTHENVVGILDSGTHEEQPYIAMELIDGETLEDLVKDRGGLPVEDALRLLRPIAAALEHVHEQGLIHRDLKPQNILIEAGTERPVLVDFGLIKAARVGEESMALTAEGSFIGTPAYMAPEQFDAEAYGRETGKADVWSFGGVLLHALTGQAPYPGATAINIYKKISTGPTPRLRDRDEDAPAWLDALCEACLRREPAERPTMAEVSEALRLRRIAAGAEPRSQLGLILCAAAVVVAALVAGLALALSGPPPELRRPSPAAGEVVVGSGGLELQVATSPGAEVIFEADGEGGWEPLARIKVGVSGLAATRLGGIAGPRELRARLAGEDSPPVVWQARPDREAPTWVSGLDAPRPGFAIVDSVPGALRLRVSDLSSVTVQLGERSAEADGEDWVVLPIEAEDWLDPVTLVAKDGLGAETRWTGWLLVGRADDPALILQDRELWNASDNEDQDAAVGEVKKRLGPTFTLVETALHARGGARHRIATFRHRSGLHLNLIPGGPALIGLPDERVEAEAEACLAAFEESLELYKAKGMKGDFDRDKAAGFKNTNFGNERPTRAVRLKPFLIGREEATWGAFWDQLRSYQELTFILGRYEQMRARMTPGGGTTVANLPITDLTIEEARALCAELGLRLPSEAEWEYAARAGTTSRYFWGERFDPKYCWARASAPPNFHQCSVQPVRYEASRANAFGLCDTLGNAWEYVQDDMGSHRNRPRDGSPLVVEGGTPVRRGGGMIFGGGAYSRVTSRGTDGAGTARTSTKGLRVACDLPRE